MKLLVTDIDATLSVGETVSREVVAACRKLRAHGWEIMVATGRTLQSALSHIAQISALDTAIVYDGARCMKTDGTEILGFELSESDAREILEFGWQHDAEVQVTCDELVCCRASDKATRSFCEGTNLAWSALNERAHEPKFGDVGRIFRVAFWNEDPSAICFLEEEMDKKFGGRFEITRGGEKFLDILAPGVSKGSALERLISGGHIEKPDFIAAAGDHLNDYELLRAADLSAAPRNCAGEILKLADFVMPSAQEHGMKFLVEHLLGDLLG